MEIFNHRTKIVFGQNGIDWLKDVQHIGNAKTACIATDTVVRDIGLLQKVTNALDQAGLEWKIFDEIQPNPTTEEIETGLKHIIETKPDLLIAIGGGSVIDAAKAIMHACLNLKKMLVDGRAIHKPEFIAIPTTSGTGSEVTSYAVITDSKSHAKIPIASEEMLPDVAILDPAFTKSVPRTVTAMTGMDVITHALEALMSKGATQLTDILAESALKICFEHLENVVIDGENIESRAQMHLASCMAGMAFNSSGLGATHAFAHAVGGLYGIPHGLANALFLPGVMRHNLIPMEAGDTTRNSETQTKLASVARRLGFSRSAKAEEANRELIEAIEALMRCIGIKQGLRHHNVMLESLQEDAADILIAAKNDICMKTNPVYMTDEKMCTILFESY